MRNILILSLLISLPAYAGFDGANAAAGSGQQVGGAAGGMNYIGRGNEMGKPVDSGSKSGSKSGSGVPAGSKGALGGQKGGKSGGGRGDCVGKGK